MRQGFAVATGLGPCNAVRFLAAFLLFVIWPIAGQSQEPSAIWQLELRAAWGGAAAQTWQGRVRVNSGSVVRVRDLGVDPWLRTYKHLEAGQLVVEPSGNVAYDACDLLIQATPESTLSVEWTSPTDQRIQRQFELPISRLIDGSHVETLDDAGNRFVLRRAPGDQLRVQCERDHLIFAPGEQWTVAIVPNVLRLEPNAFYRVRVAIVPLGGNTETWSWQSNVRADSVGELASIRPEPIPMPMDEGVYEIVVELAERPRFEVPGWRAVAVATRRVQVVVVAPGSQTSQIGPWHEQLAIDPTQSTAGTWISHLPAIPWLARREPVRMRSTASVGDLVVANQRMLRLEPGAWQAIELSLTNPQRPHLLEIEYPSHLPQALGVSLLEPNTLGYVAPLTLDGGIYVPQKVVPEPESIERYRLLFWPKSTSPILLLTNLRQDGIAVCGKIRVLASSSDVPGPKAAATDQRLAAVYFDRPLFPTNFSAEPLATSANRHAYDDWWKFYHGAVRLAQYVKYAGFNGAVICVARDGSLLYPSRHWPSTPKYDMGVFQDTGADPFSKDVVELLARVFDREGLRLVPAVHFSGRIEALSAPNTTTSSSARSGPYLFDARGRVLQTSYNPLDESFQAFVQSIVTELAKRYGHHPSFGGVAIALAPDAHLSFPDGAWGFDQNSWERFHRSLAADSPNNKPTNPEDVLHSPELRRQWLNWRAEQLAGLLARCTEVLRSKRPDAELFLTTGEWLENRAAARLLQPSPLEPQHVPIAEAALETGIDATLYRQVPGLVLFRPYRSRMSFRLPEQAVNSVMLLSESFDRYFDASVERSARRGVLIYHDRVVSRWPDFDKLSPWGPERTRTELYTHAPLAGANVRRYWIQALAAHDANAVLEGGWLLPLGQEDALRPLLEVYRSLPADQFQTVEPRSQQHVQPLLVRRLPRGDRIYVYLANRSPWPIRAQVFIEGPADLQLHTFGSRRWPSLAPYNQQWLWTLDLAPYDLIGGWLSSPRARIVDWQIQLPPEVPQALAETLKQVNLAINAAVTRPPLAVLENGHFELPSSGSTIPGWRFKPDSAGSVRLDSDAAGGRQSLYLQSNGEELWVRSAPFAPPPTGRLYVLARIKTRPGTQPQLRVVLDDDHDFYYPLAIGRGGSVAIPHQWADEFLFPFENLPLARLKEIHVGFDLIGEGEVWIDEVQLFDMWIRRDERNALLIASGIAYRNLEQFMHVTDCLHFLESFWPQLLLLSRDPVGAKPADTTLRTASRPDASDVSSGSRKPWSPIKDWVSRLPLNWPGQK